MLSYADWKPGTAMFNLLGICPKNRINNNWLLVSTEK
jgi:hypothetical protein